MYYFGYFICTFLQEHCAAPFLRRNVGGVASILKSVLCLYLTQSHVAVCLCLCYVVCTVGLMSVDECRNCTGGLYCPDYNMTTPGDSCQPGMYSVSVHRYVIGGPTVTIVLHVCHI